MLRDGHRVLVLAPGGHQHPVLALIGVAEQMPHVRDVLHVGHAVAEVAQISHEHIETDIALGVPQVRMPIYLSLIHI